MESKKINQLATELTPSLDDLTIIGDPTTGISRKITLSQMASLFTGTVEEYASLSAFPLVGAGDTIYIALDTNVLYRWNGSNYVELSPNIINSLVFNDANGFDGTIVLSGSVATLTITTALTLGSLPFIGASGALIQDNANLFFDDANNRLGIGTNTPTTPLDVFGSGIIARINGTSTNNAFLGFSSAGTNKWSVGNVQSDHRFRIFSEANTAELVSLLQTGEFGIGIANPTTKLHIDGGATALIANLDANVSVAKSLSFRSDNSNRINLEVSGTESGSDAGANFFLRTFTDAGALIETPLSIVRSTGVTTIKSLTLTNALAIANGGTGSATQNFVDLTTAQTIGGAKTLTSALSGTSATFSSTATASAFIPSGASVPTNGMYLSAANTLDFATNSTNRLSISSGGAATFSGVIRIGSGGTALGKFSVNDGTNINLSIKVGQTDATAVLLTAYNDDVSGPIPLEFRASKFNFTNGNVGIGTTTPASKLHIAQSSSAVLFSESSSVATIIGTNAAGNASQQLSLRGSPLTFTGGGGAGAEHMRIASGGNVGIGTESPTEKLEVNGSIKTAAPSGGTAKPFKIGNVATVTPTLQNRTIEIEIDGTTYYLTAKTTNN